jgi:hypothetical protein
MEVHEHHSSISKESFQVLGPPYLDSLLEDGAICHLKGDRRMATCCYIYTSHVDGRDTGPC